MQLLTYKEATQFVKGWLKEEGREIYGGLVKFDSVPAWGKAKVQHALDGSDIEAIYMSYQPADDKQKREAKPAKLSGLRTEVIKGKLIDVRRCKDGSVQVLFTNGTRLAETEGPAFRGPNVDKGILCALSVGEGLSISVEEAINRVPYKVMEDLRTRKEANTLAVQRPGRITSALEMVIEAAKLQPAGSQGTVDFLRAIVREELLKVLQELKEEVK